MQKAPIHQSHTYRQIKIFLRIFQVPIVQEAPIHQSHHFEKGHPRNIPVKLFQNLISSFGEEDFLRISSCPYIVQEAPIHQSHVFKGIKISKTIFEKGHPRNIPANFFKNFFMSL